MRVEDKRLPKKLIEFGSWGELIDYAARVPTVTAKSEQHSRFVRDDDWYGTPDFPAALNLALNGWTDAETKARTLSSVLFNKVSSLVEHDYPVSDIEGVDIEMGAYTRGEPECWTRFEKVMEEGEGKIARIVFNGFFSAGINHDVIIARGAAVAALVDLLEYSGTRCEVIYHCPFNDPIHFRTLIKSADQPLDLSRLMFAVGHPSMFRRIMFSALEHNPERESLSLYGLPYELHESQRGDVYLGCAGFPDVQWKDTESAQAWIIAELKSQGVDVKAE